MSTIMPNALLNRLFSPNNYATVTGVCEPKFANLNHALARIQPSNGNGGAALCVYYQGKKVVDIAAGLSQTQVNFNSQTLALSYSCGKAMLATLVHVLVSHGMLAYDVPISHYWQAFGQQGKQQMCLREVLCHQAGLHNIRAITQTATDMLDWQTMLTAVENMQPEFNPSKPVAYSALVYGWVVGGLIEKVTGLPLARAVAQYVTEPLGIENDMYFGVPSNQLHRVARRVKQAKQPTTEGVTTHSNIANKATKPQSSPSNHWLNSLANKTLASYFSLKGIDTKDMQNALSPKGNRHFNYYDDSVLQACIPAANGVMTASGLAKMYAMLANGGSFAQQPLIDANTFAQAIQLQNQTADRVMPTAMHWRLGYHRVFRLGKSPKTAFGHMGYNGSGGWCDPSKQLAMAYVHNYDVTMMTDARLMYLTECVLQLVHT